MNKKTYYCVDIYANLSIIDSAINILRNCVTVAQLILVQSVRVQILVPQPKPPTSIRWRLFDLDYIDILRHKPYHYGLHTIDYLLFYNTCFSLCKFIFKKCALNANS